MHIPHFLFVASAVRAATLGLSTYREIIAGQDNSGSIAYSDLDRSNTISLVIQIVAGRDNSDVIDAFMTLCQNFGPHGTSLMPRVRYGSLDGTATEEPNNLDQIMTDVGTWAKAFGDVAGIITIPVVQAGFLGLWGEWHVRTSISSSLA